MAPEATLSPEVTLEAPTFEFVGDLEDLSIGGRRTGDLRTAVCSCSSCTCFCSACSCGSSCGCLCTG
jgi:hypothetical protein